MGAMKIAVHQPNYLPWLGYFHKISRVDTFVFLDTVQYERRGYSKRTHVMGPGGEALWLTQNVRKLAQTECLVADVTFSDRHWTRKHLKTLEAAYRKTRHFDEVFSLIERSFQSDTDRLSIFNGTVIQHICRSLNIPTKIIYASQLDAGSFSSPSERIARIANHLGGTVYLSGAGARAYNDPAIFARYGIELAYNDFIVKSYPQRNREFIGGLSIVDSLFHIGFDGVASLLQLIPARALSPQSVEKPGECRAMS